MSTNACTSTACCTSKNEAQEKILHIAIIGSGSGAFAAALKAIDNSDKNSVRITMIEAADIIGGCCVNVGCVPSKILIRAAQLAEQQRKNPFIGLNNHEPILNRALLAQQQKTRVEELRQAKYQHIIDTNSAITLVKGFAKFKDAQTLIITDNQGKVSELKADKILIATGSKATIPPIKGLQNTPYWTSTEALFADKTPQHLMVIGSSVIALEIAQAYRRLGAEITIIARHTLLYKEDPLLGKELTVLFKKEGIQVLNNSQAELISHHNNQFNVTLNNGNKLTADKLLVSTGRHANTAQLQLELADITINRKGSIIVNQHLETSCENIYAIGDCSNMPQFVYVAAAAGIRAGINMTGGNAILDLSTMPAVIFTDPQVATVGLTEAEAQNSGKETTSKVLTMDNVPRALANFETDGFIKLVAEKNSNKLIGAQILAHEGGELIQTAALAIYNKMTVEQLAGQLFPYLTMVEGLKLCAQTFNKDVSELSCCAG